MIRSFLDTRGTAAIEFAMTMPVFFMIIFGIIEGGILLWAQVGLQHGVEMAARCASVNTAVCGSASTTQTFAAQQTNGFNPPASTFTVSTPACGTLVAASYKYTFVSFYFGKPSVTLTARSCFPK